MSRSLPSRVARLGLVGLGTGALVVLAANPALALPPLDAVDDVAQLASGGDGTATINLLTNDIGQDGAACNVAPATQNCVLEEATLTGVNGGTLDVNPDGGAIYFTAVDPAVDPVGYEALLASAAPCTGILDTVTYELGGALAGVPVPESTDTATVIITVGTALRGVDAVDDTGETVGTTPITAGNLLANDCDQTGATPANSGDPDGDGLPNVVAALGTQAANGTAVVNPDGTATYTANAGFAGTDSFTYSITTQDAGEPRTDTATVTVTVAAEPTPPPTTPPPGQPSPPPGAPGQPAPPQLSDTGYEALPTALVAFGLLLIGSALLIVSRRRSGRPNH